MNNFCEAINFTLNYVSAAFVNKYNLLVPFALGNVAHAVRSHKTTSMNVIQREVVNL